MGGLGSMVVMPSIVVVVTAWSRVGAHGGLDPLGDRDAFGAGHSPAADRRGMHGHGVGQLL